MFTKNWPVRLEFDWEALNTKTLFIRVETSVEEDWKTTVVMGFDTSNNHAYLLANKQERVK